MAFHEYNCHAKSIVGPMRVPRIGKLSALFVLKKVQGICGVNNLAQPNEYLLDW